MGLTVLGLDLGQRADYSAAAVVEATGRKQEVIVDAEDEEYHVPRPRAVRLEGPPIDFACRFLRRWPLATSYPTIVADTVLILRRISNVVLALDLTGVGLAVGDLFTQAGLSFVGVSITAGRMPTPIVGGYTVPKRELIGAVQVALQSGRLKIAGKLPEAATLQHELEAFDGKLSGSGHDSYDARSGEHDDLLLALCLACWVGDRAIMETYVSEWERAHTVDFPRVTISPF